MSARWTTARGNKRKQPISSRIIDIVGHTVVSLSSPFPVFYYLHRLRKKQCPIFRYECPIFTRQKLNDKMSALNCPSFHRGETNVRSWVYNLFITIKRLYARDEKGAHPSLLWKMWERKVAFSHWKGSDEWAFTSKFQMLGFKRRPCLSE